MSTLRNQSQTLSRRLFLKTLGGAAALAGLAACTTAVPGASDASQPSTAQTELGFSWWTGGEAANQVFEASIDRFEEAHPQYTVNRITTPWAEYTTKLLTMYGAGNAPDAHGLLWGPIWAFAQRGVLASLDPFVERDAEELKLDEMWPAITGMLDYPSGSNQLIVLPRETFGLYMNFYNKNIFAEAGVETPDVEFDAENWTWETWSDKARGTTKFEDSGRREIIGANQGVDLWNLAYAMPSLGVPMLSEDLSHYNLNDPAVVAWLQMIHDMVNIDQSIGKPEETGEFDWASNGKQALNTAGSWSIANKVTTWTSFEWDFVPTPKGSGGHANIPGCDFHAVNGSEGANQEGGWELIKFLNSPEEDLWWSINMFGPPFRQPNLQKWIDKVGEDLPLNGWKYVAAAMESARSWPTVPFFLELETIHENEIGQAVTGERTVDDVTNSIVEKVDEVIASFA